VRSTPSISPARTCSFSFVCSFIFMVRSGIASSSVVGWFRAGQYPSLRDVVIAVDIICAKSASSIWTMLFSILFCCAKCGSDM